MTYFFRNAPVISVRVLECRRTQTRTEIPEIRAGRQRMTGLTERTIPGTACPPPAIVYENRPEGGEIIFSTKIVFRNELPRIYNNIILQTLPDRTAFRKHNNAGPVCVRSVRVPYGPCFESATGFRET